MTELDSALFENPYARWGRSWLAAGVIAIVAGVVIAQGPIGAVGLVVASIGGTVGLILSFAFLFTGRMLQPRIDAMRRGEHLARWEIDRARWRAWRTARQRKLKLGAVIVAGLIALAGWLVAALIAFDEGDTITGAWVAGVVTLVAPVSGLIVMAHAPGRARPGAGPVPLIVAPHAALTAGAIFTWRAMGLSFDGAEVVAEPPTLRVHFTARTQHGAAAHQLDLPVPPDRLDEAAEVAAAIIEANLSR